MKMDAMRHLSLKNITIVLCICNFIAVLLLLHSIFLRHYISQPPHQFRQELQRYVEEADRARLEMEPVELIKRVREIQLESERGAHIGTHGEVMRERQANERSPKLIEGKRPGDLHKAFAEWRRRKMERGRKQES